MSGATAMTKEFLDWESVPVVLNTAEIAELLDLHPNTIKALASKGQIPAQKAGRAWRFSRDAIRDWLAGGKDE